MVRWTRISVVLGAVVLLASACGDSDTPLSPSARPALQAGGGHTAGGNVTGSDSTTTSSTSTTTVTEPTDTTTRGGGHTAGGN